ncbi:hypothetical protein, partial [Pseudomonas azotoformans]
DDRLIDATRGTDMCTNKLHVHSSAIHACYARIIAPWRFACSREVLKLFEIGLSAEEMLYQTVDPRAANNQPDEQQGGQQNR